MLWTLLFRFPHSWARQGGLGRAEEGSGCPSLCQAEREAQCRETLPLFSWTWNFHTPGPILPICLMGALGLPTCALMLRGPDTHPEHDEVWQVKAITPAEGEQWQASSCTAGAQVTAVGLQPTQGHNGEDSLGTTRPSQWSFQPPLAVTTVHKLHQQLQVLKALRLTESL